MSIEFKTAIEDALSFVIATEDQPAKFFGNQRVALTAPGVTIDYFSNLEPLQSKLLAALPPVVIEQRLVPRNALKDHPAESARVLRSLDVSWITDTINDDGSPSDRDRFSLSRIRTVPASTLRGRVKLVSSINVEFTSALVRRDLTYTTTRTYLIKSGSEFRTVDYTDARISRLSPSSGRSLEVATNMVVGIGVARHYSWAVRLGFPGSPSINLLTDPTGALELLKLRDNAKGKRRDAIVHWVSEHWRRKRNDPSISTRVRPHLRGKTSFSWDGLICEVVPSPADRDSYASGGGPALAPWDRDETPNASGCVAKSVIAPGS